MHILFKVDKQRHRIFLQKNQEDFFIIRSPFDNLLQVSLLIPLKLNSHLPDCTLSNQISDQYGVYVN